MASQDEEIYKNIIESFPLLVILLDKSGFITYVNPAISINTEYKKEEIIGKHITQLGFLKQKERDKISELFEYAQTGNPIPPVELQYISQNGKVNWGKGTVKVLRENNAIKNILIITEDITEQKHLQEKIKQSEDKRTILSEATNEGWVETNIDGKIIYVNKVGAQIVGYNQKELIGLNIRNIYANPATRREIIKEILLKKSLIDYRIPVRHKNGAQLFLSVNGILYKDEINDEKQIITTFRDVTEQTSYLQRLEALLKHAAALSRANTLEEVAEITENTLTKTIGFNIGSLGLVEGNILNHRFRWGVPTNEHLKLKLDGLGITVKAVNTGKTQLVDDVLNDPHFVDPVDPSITRSELTVPIKIGEKPVAVINIENEKPNAFTETDQKLVEIFAEQVSSVFQRIESKKAEKILLERYRGFSNAAVESFILLDNNFIILDMNEKAAERSNVKVEEVIGKSLLEFQPDLKNSPRYKVYQKVMETGESVTIDVYDHPLGFDYIRMYAFKVGEGLGLIASDLSKIKKEQEEKAKLNQELFEQRVAAEQLVKMDRMKTNFMNTATHEIRTPITSIKGYTELIELLIQERDDPELQKYLEAITRNVNRLEHLSNDLLDIQRIESNRMVLEKIKVSINDLMESIKQEMAPLLTEKKQKLYIKMEKENDIILCDEMRIMQVLINIVNNASHYSPPETDITVTVDKTDNMYRFDVKDNGEGISKKDIPKLFKPFPDIKARIQRGTGLGLSICRGIVELHGGRIWAESEGVGHGSTFSFTIPV